MLTIGQRIALYRNHRRWTQKKLASEIGIPQSVLSEIENDIVSPKWDTIIAIAACMNLPLQHPFPLEAIALRPAGTALPVTVPATRDDQKQQLIETLTKAKEELLSTIEQTIVLLKQ